jgi:hypothetical protein
MKRRYKVLRGKFGRVQDGKNVIYATGDFIDLEDDAARTLGGRVELAAEQVEEVAVVEEVVEEAVVEEEVEEEEVVVEEDVDDFLEEVALEDVVVEPHEETSEQATEELSDFKDLEQIANFAYLDDLHWTAARDVIKSLEFRAEVLAAREVERSREKPRSTVLAAIQTRLNELES